jgi:hypothetical protein
VQESDEVGHGEEVTGRLSKSAHNTNSCSLRPYGQTRKVSHVTGICRQSMRTLIAILPLVHHGISDVFRAFWQSVSGR